MYQEATMCPWGPRPRPPLLAPQEHLVREVRDRARVETGTHYEFSGRPQSSVRLQTWERSPQRCTYPLNPGAPP